MCAEPVSRGRVFLLFCCCSYAETCLLLPAYVGCVEAIPHSVTLRRRARAPVSCGMGEVQGARRAARRSRSARVAQFAPRDDDALPRRRRAATRQRRRAQTQGKPRHRNHRGFASAGITVGSIALGINVELRDALAAPCSAPATPTKCTAPPPGLSLPQKQSCMTAIALMYVRITAKRRPPPRRRPTSPSRT